MKQKRSWIEEIETGRTKEIAWEFFLDLKTQLEVQEKLSNNDSKKKELKKRETPYHIPYYSRLVKKWNGKGFLKVKQTYVEIKGKSNSTRKHPVPIYRFNIKPILEYCKERNISFDNKEKSFIKEYLDDKETRKKIKQNAYDGFIKESIKSLYFRIQDILTSDDFPWGCGPYQNWIPDKKTESSKEYLQTNYFPCKGARGKWILYTPECRAFSKEVVTFNEKDLEWREDVELYLPKWHDKHIDDYQESFKVRLTEFYKKLSRLL